MQISHVMNAYYFQVGNPAPVVSNGIERARRMPPMNFDEVYLINLFYFDGMPLIFNNTKLIGGMKVGRVSTDASGFAREHAQHMWKALQLDMHAVHTREELTRLAYSEIAKISLKRMEQMILGEDQ